MAELSGGTPYASAKLQQLIGSSWASTKLTPLGALMDQALQYALEIDLETQPVPIEALSFAAVSGLISGVNSTLPRFWYQDQITLPGDGSPVALDAMPWPYPGWPHPVRWELWADFAATPGDTVESYALDWSPSPDTLWPPDGVTAYPVGEHTALLTVTGSHIARWNTPPAELAGEASATSANGDDVTLSVAVLLAGTFPNPLS